MRDLVVEGAKKTLIPNIDVTKHADNVIYDGMEKIVLTYQSAFLSKASSFVKSKVSTMKVTIPTCSNVVSAGKQRYRRSQEHGIILSRKKAKDRTTSHPPFALPGKANTPHLSLAQNDLKTPPKIPNTDLVCQSPNEVPFTNVITSANQHKKRQGNKCSFCNLVAGHKIDRCPSRDKYKLKGLECVLTDI